MMGAPDTIVHAHTSGAAEYVRKDLVDQAVQVKPLEWNDREAKTELGVYEIYLRSPWHTKDGGPNWIVSVPLGELKRVFDTEEEAKEAAQSYYERSVFAAINIVPVSQVRDDALLDAVRVSKEPIAQIVYDGWYKNDWPVTSHGYQKVQEAVETAILALIQPAPPTGK
jgi:hypothetical protein